MLRIFDHQAIGSSKQHAALCSRAAAYHRARRDRAGTGTGTALAVLRSGDAGDVSMAITWSVGSLHGMDSLIDLVVITCNSDSHSKYYWLVGGNLIG